jgi:uncharacterized YigZ family protein
MERFADYDTVNDVYQDEMMLKGSRFIGIVMPCRQEADIQSNLSRVATELPDATHYCYAALYDGANARERSSDNGEPSGTAGKPMMAVLKGAGVLDTMVVVVRYFGGTLLGTGGLVHAYTEASKIAFAKVSKRRMVACCKFIFHLSYPDHNQFVSKCSNLMVRKPECEYSERVDIRAWVRVGDVDEFVRRVTDLTERRAVLGEPLMEYMASDKGA